MRDGRRGKPGDGNIPQVLGVLGKYGFAGLVLHSGTYVSREFGLAPGFWGCFPGVRACSRVLGLFPRGSGLLPGSGVVSQGFGLAPGFWGCFPGIRACSRVPGLFPRSPPAKGGPFLQSAGHSVRRATTGSFLAALREGIIPEKSVSPVLMRIKIRATWGGRYALRVWIPVTL